MKARYYIPFGCLILMQPFITYTKKNKKNIHKDLFMIKTGDNLNLSDFCKAHHDICYQITQQGTGTKPCAGETATVHYTGWLLNPDNTIGVSFDSSHKRNQPFSFKVGCGQVIAGWDNMVADMHVGEKRIVILPPKQAYGSRGAGGVIPPNATLVFEIELLSTK